MKIIFTGGGTGGHFYPIIAIVEEMRQILRERKLLEPQMYFLAPDAYDKGLLFDHNIEFRKIPSGKWRRYFSVLNYLDLFKLSYGIIKAIYVVFKIYPDVIFSKGGFGSIPTVFAGRILRIPIIIHESDSAPGISNKWAGKFATKIAITYPSAGSYFPKDKVAWTGNPVRKAVRIPAPEGGHKFLGFIPEIKTILILGGSQGSVNMNNAVIESIASLVENYQIIHQVGRKNFDEVKRVSALTLQDVDPKLKDRHKIYDYLNDLAMRMSAGAADLVITRAGSTLSEISSWGLPAIIIPIPTEVSHDQQKNAYEYARGGGATVIEENNLTPEILSAEIRRILENEDLYKKMSENAKSFAKPNAGKVIANEILKTALNHEK